MSRTSKGDPLESSTANRTNELMANRRATDTVKHHVQPAQVLPDRPLAVKTEMEEEKERGENGDLAVNFRRQIIRSLWIVIDWATPFGNYIIAAIILGIGLGLGLGLPLSSTQEHYDPSWVGRFSNIIGWTYFAAWSISFYPQIFQNLRRMSVEGLSFEFVALNILGFACYTANDLTYTVNPTMIAAFEAKNHVAGNGGAMIEINDLFFVCHALFLTIVTGVQCLVLDRGDQTIWKIAVYFIAIIVFFIVIYAIVLGGLQTGAFAWVDFLQVLSYIKVAISFLKYIPQMIRNYRRKSTVGWNITNVLLDFTGGSLSVIQMFLDGWATGNLTASMLFSGAKLPLGLLSIAFDIIFMFQHYVFYTDREDKKLSGAQKRLGHSSSSYSTYSPDSSSSSVSSTGSPPSPSVSLSSNRGDGPEMNEAACIIRCNSQNVV